MDGTDHYPLINDMITIVAEKKYGIGKSTVILRYLSRSSWKTSSNPEESLIRTTRGLNLFALSIMLLVYTFHKHCSYMLISN